MQMTIDQINKLQPVLTAARDSDKSFVSYRAYNARKNRRELCKHSPIAKIHSHRRHRIFQTFPSPSFHLLFIFLRHRAILAAAFLSLSLPTPRGFFFHRASLCQHFRNAGRANGVTFGHVTNKAQRDSIESLAICFSS